MNEHLAFAPGSRWIRYDKSTELWIPNRKRIYLYWYKFLQLSLSESPELVDMDAYMGWGTPEEILCTKFDDWWISHWMDLFGYPEGGTPSYSLSTTRPKTDAIRYAYLVYTNQHRGSNWEIGQWIQRHETGKRGVPVPSFAYATDGVEYSAEDKLVVQSRVGRYMKQAIQILRNVQNGTFP